MKSAGDITRGHRARRTGLALALAFGLAAVPAIEAAYADPPPWAPAHGWRAKNKGKNKNKKKHKVEAHQSYYDYAPTLGIDGGHCNLEVIGALLGAAGGGYAGSKIGKGDGKLAAVGAGVFLGALIGGAIGREMNEMDQNCVGHALESAQDGQAVAWQNPDGGHYEITPTSTFQNQAGQYCREYQTDATIGGRSERLYGTSCRQSDGSWALSK